MTRQEHEFEEILTAAHEAAAKAIVEHQQKFGDRDACGFAWAKVKGNTPFAMFCKKRVKQKLDEYEGSVREVRHLERTLEQRYGSLNRIERGWDWWAPGSANYHGQSISTYEAGVRAFVEKLAEHGIEATKHSRMD